MKTPRCRVCGEPIVFVPIFGWQHLSLAQFIDHGAKERIR